MSGESLMECREIKPGMVFDSGDGRIGKIEREGTYALDEGGNRKPIDNRRKNKWWVSGLGSSEMLCCFDMVWDNNKKYRFLTPKEATQ